jgi:hypothetical protein
VTHAFVWLAGLSLLLASGCQKPKTLTLKDTEGRAIAAKCDRDGKCELTLRSGEHESKEKTGLALYNPGNLIGICDVVTGKPPESPSDCRPLVCSTDGECPPKHELDHGTCINGLCREPAVEKISVEDSVMLCLAGTGLGTTHPDRMALGLNCGSPCRVPSICRQP